MQERTSVPRTFEGAMLEALHADVIHTRDEPEEQPFAGDPVERRIREWDHDIRKWRIVHRASQTW